ncbi:MAG: hypothetical protein K5798_03020 [Nitrosopumilus sp.]|nr:hypothetical protein [Nitrosopumilus sp.]
MKTSFLRKLSFSLCLIVIGFGLLMIFTFLLPTLIDSRLMPTHSNIPMIILYGGWILLAIGIWQILSHKFARRLRNEN